MHKHRQRAALGRETHGKKRTEKKSEYADRRNTKWTLRFKGTKGVIEQFKHL